MAKANTAKTARTAAELMRDGKAVDAAAKRAVRRAVEARAAKTKAAKGKAGARPARASSR